MDFDHMNGEMVVDNSDIVFLIHYGEHTIRLELPETEKVENVKRRLIRKTGLLMTQMELLGWDFPDDVSEEVCFADLGLPKEYHLVLSPKNSDDPNDERLSQVYHFQITDTENDEIYNLFFNGLQSVYHVKAHVAQLSSITIDRQIWNGWPFPIDDFQYLYEVGLRTPKHDLVVSRNHESSSVEQSPSSRSHNFPPADFNLDMIEDDDDIGGVAGPRIAHRGSLIPDAMLPMTDAVRMFIENFEKRYGTNHAPFFEGPLRDAITFAFDRSPPNRQLLAIYLHNDRSISVNIFVSQILQDPVLVNFIRDHVILWPWDITNPEARTVIRNEIHELIGEEITLPFLMGNASSVDRFPILLICAKIKGTIELVRYLDGAKSQAETLDAFEFAENTHARAQEQEVQDQQARLHRAMMVQEQNEAYQASLEADRAKEEAKKMVENKKKQEEAMARELEIQRFRRQEDARASLPEEPPQGTKESVTVIRLRTPDGKSLTRRFLTSAPLRQLYIFAHANGFPVEEFNLVCAHPRRELTNLDPELSFKDLGLTQQLAMFVEER